MARLGRRSWSSLFLFSEAQQAGLPCFLHRIVTGATFCLNPDSGIVRLLYPRPCAGPGALQGLEQPCPPGADGPWVSQE